SLLGRGQAGIGKTALLGAARGRASDMTVLAVRGLEAEAELPFAALRDLVEPLLGHLSSLPGSQAAAVASALALGPPVPGDRFAVSAGTLGLLRAAGAERPTLVLVDDAQWLDDGSLESMLFAARRLGDAPVLVLAAA